MLACCFRSGSLAPSAFHVFSLALLSPSSPLSLFSCLSLCHSLPPPSPALLCKSHYNQWCEADEGSKVLLTFSCVDVYLCLSLYSVSLRSSSWRPFCFLFAKLVLRGVVQRKASLSCTTEAQRASENTWSRFELEFWYLKPREISKTHVRE